MCGAAAIRAKKRAMSPVGFEFKENLQIASLIGGAPGQSVSAVHDLRYQL